jgi:hypothetical protein
VKVKSVRKRAKKQGVGGKPTVVKAMKDNKKDMKGKKGMVMVIAVTAKPKGKDKVAVKKTDDAHKMGRMEQCHTCGNMFPNYRMLSQHQQQTGH